MVFRAEKAAVPPDHGGNFAPAASGSLGTWSAPFWFLIRLALLWLATTPFLQRRERVGRAKCEQPSLLSLGGNQGGGQQRPLERGRGGGRREAMNPRVFRHADVPSAALGYRQALGSGAGWKRGLRGRETSSAAGTGARAKPRPRGQVARDDSVGNAGGAGDPYGTHRLNFSPPAGLWTTRRRRAVVTIQAQRIPAAAG